MQNYRVFCSYSFLFLSLMGILGSLPLQTLYAPLASSPCWWGHGNHARCSPIMGKMGNHVAQSSSKFTLVLCSGMIFFFLRQYFLEAGKETQTPGWQSKVVPSHAKWWKEVCLSSLTTQVGRILWLPYFFFPREWDVKPFISHTGK